MLQHLQGMTRAMDSAMSIIEQQQELVKDLKKDADDFKAIAKKALEVCESIKDELEMLVEEIISFDEDGTVKIPESLVQKARDVQERMNNGT